MENNIRIFYGNDEIESISPNTPTFEKLKDFIIKHVEDLDDDLIKCSCEKTDFDIKTFEKAIKESIKAELDNLKINKSKFEEAKRLLETDK